MGRVKATPVGQMRDRVTIQSKDETADEDDAIGGVVDSWTDVETRWAEVSPLSATESLRAGQLEGQTAFRVTLRHVSYLTPKYRLKYGTRYLNISSVYDQEERQRYTICNCTEVTT